MSFKPSEQQQAVIDAVKANDHDVQVQARAGTGKTTTILMACGQAKGKVGFFAFNKSIATELKEKAPPRVNVQTLHSLGFRVIRSNFKATKVDADKTYNLIIQETTKEERDLITPIKKLVGLVKNNLIREPTNKVLEDLALEYDVQLNGGANRIFEVTRKVMSNSVPSRDAKRIIIDFDDMIWLPAFMELPGAPKFDWVFLDEAQDVNAAQMELVEMVSGRGRVCFVGDDHQAIYAFRGADSRAMTTLTERLQAQGRTVKVYPINRTFRCPKSIVEVAKAWVPDFEALDVAPPGIVREVNYDDFQPEVEDMCLCRLNAPLVGPAYTLLRAKVPVKIQGRDIGAGLKNVIKKLRPDDIMDLLTKLEDYHQKETQTIYRRYAGKPSKQETALIALEDKVETLRVLASEAETVEGLTDTIERLFADVKNSKNVVLLSTIHKAKGLESERVWIIPAKEFDGPQETNLKYVAATRAKNELIYIRAVPESAPNDS